MPKLLEVLKKILPATANEKKKLQYKGKKKVTVSYFPDFEIALTEWLDFSLSPLKAR